MVVSQNTAPLLRVQDVRVRFGGIVALDGVSFGVGEGRIVGLIGPNGAGKTTLFNCVSRLYECDSGEIAFAGASLLAHPRHRVAGLGIGRTFQNLALFRSMSVLDNVMVGHHSRTGGGFLANALRLPGVADEEADSTRRAEELVHFLGLESVARQRVAELPFGTRKR
ncbi:MAG TPA: ATP-binding cassette domain-containing protein, partial [Burkholderiales bacterium]